MTIQILTLMLAVVAIIISVIQLTSHRKEYRDDDNDLDETTKEISNSQYDP